MNNAYISFLSTDNYTYYLLGLYDSLKATNPKYSFYCCLTENVAAEAEQFLNSIGINTIRLDTTPFKAVAENSRKMGMQDNWVKSTTKLAVLGLTQFDKCVFLDSDLCIINNIDDLFEKPHMSAVEDGCPVPHPEHKNYSAGMSLFCAGLFVFSPDAKFYNKLVRGMTKLPNNIEWNDQNILAYYYKDWMSKSELHLDAPYLLNLGAPEFIWYNKQYKYDDIKVKHYICHKKAPFTEVERVGTDDLFKEYMAYFTYLNSLIDKYNCTFIEKADLTKLAGPDYSSKNDIKADGRSHTYLYF